MKRALLLFLAILAIGGALASWWFLRDTPDKVLRDGLTALVTAQSATSFNIDVSWTDFRTRQTSGFSSYGQADLKDLARPRSFGVLRLSASDVQSQDQTGDLIVERDVFAVRPRSVKTEWRKLVQDLSDDPLGETFLLINRDSFLAQRGYEEAVAKGSTDGIRQALSFAVPIFYADSDIITEKVDGKDALRVQFKADTKAIKPFLLSMIAAWAKDNPTPVEISWAEKVAESLAAGNYRVSVSKDSRLPVLLDGDLPQYDLKGREIKRIKFSLEIGGLNQKVNIGIPEKTKKVTDIAAPDAKIKTLPQAKLKSFPISATTTGGARAGDASTSTAKLINERETDLFNKYYEDLLKKKQQY